MLEFMDQGGMRIGEVLNLTALDVDDQKLTIRYPKSGKSAVVVFILPKKLANRLKDYPKARGAAGDQRISYQLHRRSSYGQEGPRLGRGFISGPTT